MRLDSKMVSHPSDIPLRGGPAAFLSGLFLLYSFTFFFINLLDFARSATFVDEGFVAFVVVLGCSKAISRGTIPVIGLIIAAIALVILVSGAFGLWWSEVSPPSVRLSLVTTSAIIDLKIFALTIAVITILHNESGLEIDHLSSSIAKTVAWMGVANLPFLFHDILYGFNVHGVILETRAGAIVPVGIFNSKYESAFLALSACVSSLVLAKFDKRRILYTLLVALQFLALVAIASVKELAGVFCAFLLMLMFNSRSQKRSLILIGAILIICAVLATQNRISVSTWNRFDTFIGNDTFQTVRTRMYEVAPTIAVDFFPFGSGWGTFGSSPSRDIYYSPLYHQYGISYLHGGSVEDAAFLIDTFWPKILAEQGFFGTFLYLSVWMLAIRRLATSSTSIGLCQSAVFSSTFIISIAVVSFATPVLNYSTGSVLGGFSLAFAFLFDRNRPEHSNTSAA